MAADFTAKTVWNMDEARMREINNYLVACEQCLLSWDLELLYTYLLQVRRLCSGKFTTQEYKKLGTDLIDKIEKLRRELNPDEERKYNNDRILIYNLCDELYIELNRLLVKHGLFFRVGDDPTRAALRR